MKPKRKIHLPSGIWQYHVGQSHIAIWHPDGRKLVIPITDLPKGFHVARGRWKKNSDGAILPSEIKQYIENKILCIERN